MAYTRIWDEDDPADQDEVSEGALKIRQLKEDFRERLNRFSPVGLIIHWPTETAPDGWMECAGISLLRASYLDLYGVIGTTFGYADATHFNLPDMRGIIPRAWDHGAGVDLEATGSVTGTATISSTTLSSVVFTKVPRIGSVITNASYLATGTTIIAYDETALTITLSTAATATSPAGTTFTYNGDAIGTTQYDENKSHIHNSYLGFDVKNVYWYNIKLTTVTGNSGGNEFRPKNIYGMYIIRTDPL